MAPDLKWDEVGISSALQAVFDSQPVLRLPRMHTVFRQGEPANEVYYIKTGGMQTIVVSDHGKEGVIALYGPGDFVGEGCLAGQDVRLATATTIVESHLIRLEKTTMIRLLEENPVFSKTFMAFMVLRNIRVEADLVDQLFNSSEKRLARLLLTLANFDNGGAPTPIIPKISQATLAARVGTTRGRINYFMNKFRKLGLIEYNGNLKVHKSLLNLIIRE